jgi:serine/threonine protein kinase
MFGPRIGKGSFAVVYEGKYAGTHVAVKEILCEPAVAREDWMAAFAKECTLMLQLRHPNVMLFMGACVTDDKLYMVTELLPRGSVYDVYSNKRLDRGVSALQFCINVALDGSRGMQYLHSLDPPLIHRDIKSANILLDENYTGKVADFGLSRFKDSSRTMTMVGSPLWVAPEVLRAERFAEPCDVYSFAIVMWEMATLCEPFPGMGSNTVMKGVCKGYLRPEKTRDIPDDLWGIMQLMWADDPKERPTFGQVVNRLQDLKEKWRIAY